MNKIATDAVLTNLAQRGLVLPPPPKPGGSYQSVRSIGGVAYVAAQFPFRGNELIYCGRLGQELTTQEGYRAAELCALNVLAQIHHYIGFEQVVGLNRFEVYMQTADGWDEFPKAVDGASDLFLYALGDAGKHARALFGIERLPLNSVMELTASFTVRE